MTEPTIQRIQLLIQTGTESGAGTDGDIYLGICGREFHADTTADDFENGSSRTYVFGDGANVLNASTNDPREQRLPVARVDALPVYIRFQPRSSGDNWRLRLATVTLNGLSFPLWETASVLIDGIWLGQRSGLYLHLLKHRD